MEESANVSIFEEYDTYQRTAMLAYVDGKYEVALLNFEKAFAVKNDESENDYFFAAASALRLQENNKAKEFIKDAIVINNANKSYFENFEEFDGFRHLDLMVSIDKDYETYQNKYLDNQENPDLDNRLNELMDLDQAVRDGRSSEDMNTRDSLNIMELIEITEKYGWQDKSWLLLWHQRGKYQEDNYVWSYFRPLIDSLIAEGQIRPDYWSRYEDEKLMFSKGVQKYGTYWNNYDDYPVENVETIDELRNEVGLPPLWYMNKVYHSNLPDGYTGKDPNKTPNP